MSIKSGLQFKGNDIKGIPKNYGKFGFGALLLGTAFSYTVIYFRRSLLSWFIISMILSIGGLWVLAKQRVNSQQTVKTRSKFRFLLRENWHEELRTLRVKKDLEDPIVNEHPGVALCFSRLIDLILSEFIDVWFTRISTDTLFQDSIRVELKFVLYNLSSRLKALDIVAVLVNKIVPKFNDHYARFTTLKQPNNGAYSLEDKLSVAREFANGGLHRGVTLSVSGFEAKNQEKQILRGLITDVLPFLLSPRERSNKLVNSLLTELLSCTFLANVFTVLCEGDFFNLMIVKVVGSNLHHRGQVKRLREALVQHTTVVHDDSLGAPGTIIDGANSSASEESWIKSLGIGDSPKEPGYLNSVLIQEVTFNNGGLGECDVNIVKIPPKPKKLLLPTTKTLNLDIVLAEPKYASVFREFLRTSKQEGIFDLWKDIESMRAPLESTDTSEVPLLLEFSNAHDILRIYEKYLSRPDLKVSDSVRINIAKYARNSLANDAASYQIARQALLELQNNIYSDMKKKQFVEFQNSRRFLDLMASSPTKVSKSRIFSSGFRRGDVEDFKDGSNTDFRENSPVSPAVITAVESAFRKIMETSDVENKCSPLETPEQVFISSNFSHKTSQVSLFGDSKSLESSALRSDSMNRLSALFENKYESDSDANSVSSEHGMDNSESPNMLNSGLLLAPPGDLSLMEKIDVLDQGIQNLSQQNEVLLSLLKKAELTNNVAELKILRRSNASLEKEIKLKELQKQQYIVQENDNSLYGKSKVRIQSCVFGKDENLPYVIYVIEVQKYSSEDPNVIVAGWIVARRFSQFFKLHEFLKKGTQRSVMSGFRKEKFRI